MNFRRLFQLCHFILGLLLAVLVFCCFFFRPDISENQKENSVLIGASYMTMNNELFAIINEQIAHRVDAEGDRMVLRVSESDSGLADCTIVSDNYRAGRLVGEYFLSRKEEAGQEEARLVILTHEEAASGVERVQGFLDTVSGQEGVTVVQKIPCEGKLELAMPRMEKFIEKGIPFDSVFCLNDPACIGAAAALDASGLLEQTSLYGVDASPDAKAMIRDGSIQASAAQFPTRVGEEAADAIYHLLNGEKVDPLILVPVELVTKENVESYSVDRWQ